MQSQLNWRAPSLGTLTNRTLISAGGHGHGTPGSCALFGRAAVPMVYTAVTWDEAQWNQIRGAFQRHIWETEYRPQMEALQHQLDGLAPLYQPIEREMQDLSARFESWCQHLDMDQGKDAAT